MDHDWNKAIDYAYAKLAELDDAIRLTAGTCAELIARDAMDGNAYDHPRTRLAAVIAERAEWDAILRAAHVALHQANRGN